MKFSLLLLFAFVSTCWSPVAYSKDLYGRMGLGYNAEFANTTQTNGVPAISFKYGFAPRLALELVAGFYSGTGGTGVAALKLMQTMHAESYLNFYYLFGAGLVSANSVSGTEFLGGLGTEFFIPGIESVGFSFETGIAVENLTSPSKSFVLETFGLSFIQAGMHFYF